VHSDVRSPDPYLHETRNSGEQQILHDVGGSQTAESCITTCEGRGYLLSGTKNGNECEFHCGSVDGWNMNSILNVALPSLFRGRRTHYFKNFVYCCFDGRG
jgi:hypothetical protein